MKVTNPNDLRSIVNSAEGVGSEASDEIQNLAVGSAMVCGIVDRPLVVRVRLRRSLHGGEAVNVLGGVESSVASEARGEERSVGNREEVDLGASSEELVVDDEVSMAVETNESVGSIADALVEKEEEVDVVGESASFAARSVISIVPSKLSVKDIKLISEKPVSSITTYLIPAFYVKVSIDGYEFFVLIDRIKGKVILDPDVDSKVEISEISASCAFLRKPMFLEFSYDVLLDAVLGFGEVKVLLSSYCSVLDYTETNIVFHKVDY